MYVPVYILCMLIKFTKSVRVITLSAVASGKHVVILICRTVLYITLYVHVQFGHVDLYMYMYRYT